MKRETGFTLMEVLIAVLVLSIGLLGLAALQTMVLRSNHGGDLRTQATFLAYDMSDRMRANMAGASLDAADYDNPPEADVKDYNCVWDGESVTFCTAKQMAMNDIFKWNAAVARDLPQGLGVVCLDSTPNDGDGDVNANDTLDADEKACGGGSSYAIKLWWVEGFDADGDPVIKRFSTAVQP